MTFQTPLLLWLLVLLVPAAMALYRAHRKTSRNLARVGEDATGVRRRAMGAGALFLVFQASLAIVAAGPQRYTVNPEEDRTGTFLFLADVSRSMAARLQCDDLMPLDRARSLMAAIVTGLPMAGFAYSAFSELAFPLSEVSYDRTYLREIGEHGIFVEVVPVPGSDVANAFLVVLEKKEEEPAIYEKVEHVVLFSDGDWSADVMGNLETVLPRLRESGVTVITIGIGSEEARPIPTLGEDSECLEGQYERAEGKEFYTHLFDSPLRLIAEQTGGRYFSDTQRADILEYLQSTLESAPGREPPVQTTDLSGLFLAMGTLSLLGVIGLRRF